MRHREMGEGKECQRVVRLQESRPMLCLQEGGLVGPSTPLPRKEGQRVEKRVRSLAVVNVNKQPDSAGRGLKNVASVKGADELFISKCRINGFEYTCELDNATSDILLSEVAANYMRIQDQAITEEVAIRDGTSVQPVGTARATVEVDGVRAEELIHILCNEQESGLITLGSSWGNRRQPSLNWKDFLIRCPRAD